MQVRLTALIFRPGSSNFLISTSSRVKSFFINTKANQPYSFLLLKNYWVFQWSLLVENYLCLLLCYLYEFSIFALLEIYSYFLCWFLLVKGVTKVFLYQSAFMRHLGLGKKKNSADLVHLERTSVFVDLLCFGSQMKLFLRVWDRLWSNVLKLGFFPSDCQLEWFASSLY